MMYVLKSMFKEDDRVKNRESIVNLMYVLKSMFKEDGSVENWESIVNLMDDEIREQLNAELADGYMSDAEFLWNYCERHLEKYGEEFTI